jgi:hypothetical protein
MPNNTLSLYNKYFIDRDHERLDLFQRLYQQYHIQSALYPGSFVHITPAFVFPTTAYVDNDKQAIKFFAQSDLMPYIQSRKSYPQPPTVTFYPQDYRTPLPEPDQQYDLLISQYAGFISQHGKRYLKLNGRLLANNSHGDASMAFLDPDYTLTAVIHRRNGRYSLSTNNLDSYFIPKKPIEITKAYLEERQKGIAYAKTAASYLFQRTR